MAVRVLLAPLASLHFRGSLPLALQSFEIGLILKRRGLDAVSDDSCTPAVVSSDDIALDDIALNDIALNNSCADLFSGLASFYPSTAQIDCDQIRLRSIATFSARLMLYTKQAYRPADICNLSS